MKVRTGKYSATPGVDGIGRGGPCLITDHNTRSQEGEDSLGMILSNGSGSLHFTGFSQNVLWGEQGTLEQYSSLRHGLGMQTSNGEQRGVKCPLLEGVAFLFKVLGEECIKARLFPVSIYQEN